MLLTVVSIKFQLVECSTCCSDADYNNMYCAHISYFEDGVEVILSTNMIPCFYSKNRSLQNFLFGAGRMMRKRNTTFYLARVWILRGEVLNYSVGSNC